MLLLPNKPPLTVSEVPQSRRSLAGRFWLRISREVAVRGQGVRGSGVSGPVGQGWEPERAGDLLPRRLSHTPRPQASAPCQQEASAPRHVGLSTGLFPTWQLTLSEKETIFQPPNCRLHPVASTEMGDCSSDSTTRLGGENDSE